MEEDADEGQRSGEPTLFNSETATTAWGQTAHHTGDLWCGESGPKPSVQQYDCIYTTLLPKQSHINS